MRLRGDHTERAVAPRELPAHYADGFAYLAAVVRGTEQVANTDRSSLANNLIVVRILDAARRSARTGQTVSVQPGRAAALCQAIGTRERSMQTPRLECKQKTPLRGHARAVG